MTEHGRNGESLMLVETYRPAAGPAARALAPGDGDGAVRVRSAIVVPGDEVVFYLVTGPSAAEVRRALAELGIDSLRVVPATCFT